MTTDRDTAEAIERAVRIARRIRAAGDVDIQAAIRAYEEEPDFGDRESLGIEKNAWEYIRQADIQPRLVFAHPDVLVALPRSTLHYRGISLLSRKRVASIARVPVDSWEKGKSPRVTAEQATRAAQLFNTVISSIIVDSTDWTLENGYRNILATLGITEDGSIRNWIGQKGERAIREGLRDWVQSEQLVIDKDVDDLATEWNLEGGVRMVFGSEPDVGFWKGERLVVVIEIKAGTDPAGSLERLGAVKKTFDESPAGCKNFLITAVTTTTMSERLKEMRLERVFDMGVILDTADGWSEFVNDIFHHALRIAPEVLNRRTS